MFKNYIKITIRTLMKNNLHSFINILGLSVAIATCIVGYVNYQFSQSYDKFHENGDSIITIIIVATGLFALIALNIEKKTKEIAVRKILGASLIQVLRVLMNEFILIFIISICIAAGLGTFLVSTMAGSIWKECSGMDSLPVIYAASIIIGIAVITLGIQLQRIRDANPVESLKSE